MCTHEAKITTEYATCGAVNPTYGAKRVDLTDCMTDGGLPDGADDPWVLASPPASALRHVARHVVRNVTLGAIRAIYARSARVLKFY